MSVNHTRLELEGKNPGFHFKYPSFYMYLLPKGIYIYIYMIIYQSKQTIFIC